MHQRIVNRNIVRIVGMSRSGNHAIINWILAQLPGRWCFLNCVEPKSSPFQTARPADDGKCFRTNIPEFDLEAERSGEHVAKDHLVFSHEDTFLDQALGEATTAVQESSVGASVRRVDVLILRDAYNLFASRRRFGHQRITDGTARRMWKQHARVFIGEQPKVRRPSLRVSYNRWVRDRAYRALLAAALGLSFTDAGRERVASYGGGSSFDGYRFQDRAFEMKVFDRWRWYADDEHFQSMFDAEIRRLAKHIFGFEQAPFVGR